METRQAGVKTRSSLGLRKCKTCSGCTGQGTTGAKCRSGNRNRVAGGKKTKRVILGKRRLVAQSGKAIAGRKTGRKKITGRRKGGLGATRSGTRAAGLEVELVEEEAVGCSIPVPDLDQVDVRIEGELNEANEDTKMKKIDTKHFCLFCLKPGCGSVNESGAAERKEMGSRYMRLLSRHLNLQLFSDNDDSMKNVWDKSLKPGNLDCEISVCDSCLVIQKDFCDLYHQQQLIQMQLDNNVETMRKIMRLAEKVPSRETEFRANVLEGSNAMKKEEQELLNKFKRRFFQKSKRKMYPQVVLQRHDGRTPPDDEVPKTVLLKRSLLNVDSPIQRYGIEVLSINKELCLTTRGARSDERNLSDNLPLEQNLTIQAPADPPLAGPSSLSRGQTSQTKPKRMKSILIPTSSTGHVPVNPSVNKEVVLAKDSSQTEGIKTVNPAIVFLKRKEPGARRLATLKKARSTIYRINYVQRVKMPKSKDDTEVEEVILSSDEEVEESTTSSSCGVIEAANPVEEEDVIMSSEGSAEDNEPPHDVRMTAAKTISHSVPASPNQNLFESLNDSCSNNSSPSQPQNLQEDEWNSDALTMDQDVAENSINGESGSEGYIPDNYANIEFIPIPDENGPPTETQPQPPPHSQYQDSYYSRNFIDSSQNPDGFSGFPSYGPSANLQNGMSAPSYEATSENMGGAGYFADSGVAPVYTTVITLTRTITSTYSTETTDGSVPGNISIPPGMYPFGDNPQPEFGTSVNFNENEHAHDSTTFSRHEEPIICEADDEDHHMNPDVPASSQDNVINETGSVQIFEVEDNDDSIQILEPDNITLTVQSEVTIDPDTNSAEGEQRASSNADGVEVLT